MKLLIIGLNYAPEPVGIGPYTAGLAESFALRGHQVEVIAGEAYYPQWRRQHSQPPAGQRNLEAGVGVTRLRHYIPANPTGIRRVLHLLSFAVSALLPSLRTAKRFKPDLVFTVAPSLLSVPSAWLAARRARAKLWVHVQDFEVEAAFATGLIDDRGIAARLARWTESRVLGMADHVSTISPQMLAKLGDKGLQANRTSELRNWANSAFAPDPAEAERYRTEWSVGKRKVALYSGNIANKQGIEIVIEAARLLGRRDDLLFVICGQGPNRARLEALAETMGNVEFRDLQPAERMGGLLSLAAIHLLPQIPGAADLVLPSKLTNMLISGRPVVATADHGTGLADEVEGCGIVTRPGDAQALADSIELLIDDDELRAKLGTMASRRAAERWQRDSVIVSAETDMNRLLCRRSEGYAQP